MKFWNGDSNYSLVLRNKISTQRSLCENIIIYYLKRIFTGHFNDLLKNNQFLTAYKALERAVFLHHENVTQNQEFHSSPRWNELGQ